MSEVRLPNVGASSNDRFVLHKAHERGVTAVELWATDPAGRVQVVSVPIDALDEALEDGFAVASEALGEAFERVHGQDPGEVYLAPDPATFCVMSSHSQGADAHGGTARLICDLRQADGSPSPLCARTALKRTLGRATQLGSHFYVGATVLHHWLAGPDDDQPLTARRLIRTLGQETGRALEALGIAWRSHYLGIDGHFCLELDWVDPLTLADAIVTHRRVVHDLALDLGASATFAPFPWLAERSRMDLYISLMRDGAAAFQDMLDPDGLAPAARTFIRAIEAEAGGLELFMRSTLQSYVQPESPVVCRGSSARGEGGATVLVRGADACANPYTLLTAVLGLGADASEAATAKPVTKPAPAQTLLEAAHRASLSPRLRDLLGPELIESLSSLGDVR